MPNYVEVDFSRIVRFENIPQILQEIPSWIVWKIEFNDKGEPTKVPYTTNNTKAKTNDPATWSDFAEVRAAFLQMRNGEQLFDGVGFVFNKDYGIVGIDLDHCCTLQLDPVTGEEVTTTEQWAQDIV